MKLLLSLISLVAIGTAAHHDEHPKHMHLRFNKNRNTNTNTNTNTNPPPGNNPDHFDYADFHEGAWKKPHCVNNSRPSPVNLVPGESGCHGDQIYVDFEANQDYIETDFVNNGHTLVAKAGKKGVYWDKFEVDLFEDGEATYGAEQFHFHSPSEHTVNGEHYDLEMHIVHTLQKKSEFNGHKFDQVAVVGFFFNVDEDAIEEDVELFNIFDPKLACKQNENGCGGNKSIQAQFDTFDLAIDEYYHYQGSFTTPPCSPIASWFISSEVRQIKPKQLENFQKYWSKNSNFARNHERFDEEFHEWVGNNRPTQGDVVPLFVDEDKCWGQ